MATHRLTSVGDVATIQGAEAYRVRSGLSSNLPGRFALLGNYPNPFRERTQVSVDLPADATVSVEVYDLLGRRLIQQEARLTAGTARSVQVDARDLASGMYLYRIRAEMATGEVAVDAGQWTVVK